MSRDFDVLSTAQLAAGLVSPRRVDLAGLTPDAEPKAIADLLDAIDHVAEAATGERTFLHLQPRPERTERDAPARRA